MNASNRFEIETLARHQQADIERNLHRAGRFGDARSSLGGLREGPNLRAALILAGTAAVSTALALGMTQLLVIGFAVLR